ncbi:hypothetical protein DY000_02005984 [Brassica cretica]|uniref:Uncharacterized protein n=1 Tax=Brassica cretica TaxID=69181 RepID=A0ABQ7C5H5_BRACR|nr:hypothetical protein DY000_02005984 [Brassica cretica]
MLVLLLSAIVMAPKKNDEDGFGCSLVSHCRNVISNCMKNNLFRAFERRVRFTRSSQLPPKNQIPSGRRSDLWRSVGLLFPIYFLLWLISPDVAARAVRSFGVVVRKAAVCLKQGFSERFPRHGLDLARSERRTVSGLVCPSVGLSIGESFRSNPWLVLAVRVWLTFWWLRRISSEVGAFLLLASPFSGCGGGVVWLGDGDCFWFSKIIAHASWSSLEFVSQVFLFSVQYCGGLASSSNPNKSIPGVLALVVPLGKATLLFSVDAHCVRSI